MKKSLLLIILFIASIYTGTAAEKYPFTATEKGTGPAVIFIPGFACSGEVWKETTDQLQQHHTCYVLNMAGFAGVPATDNPDIENWVQQIARFITDKKIGPVTIVGHSLGGVMAQWLAADYPQLVSKIVVVDALPCLPALSNPAFKSSPQPDCSMFTGNFTAMKDPQFYQMQRVTMTNMLADTTQLESVVQWSMHSDRKTMALIYCQLFNTDLRAKIKGVQCPALILLEPSFKALHLTMKEQYANLGNAQLQYAGKGLHFIMYDDKDWYFGQLKNFIQ